MGSPTPITFRATESPDQIMHDQVTPRNDNTSNHRKSKEKVSNKRVPEVQPVWVRFDLSRLRQIVDTGSMKNLIIAEEDSYRERYNNRKMRQRTVIKDSKP